MLKKLLLATLLFTMTMTAENRVFEQRTYTTVDGKLDAVINARVWTANPAMPWTEALAASGENIIATGPTTEIKKLTNAKTRIIDAHGQMLVPGFIDSHVHFLDGGFSLASVQLRDAKTKDQFIARIKAFAATVPRGTWITAGDWDHQNWGGELPTRQWIDD